MKNILSYNELHLISEQLDGMLLKHIDWLSSLHKVIICKLSSGSLKMHHSNCDFGKWYYSVDNPFLNQNPDFLRLDVAHNNLHAIANQLIDQYENNKTPSKENYELFIDSEKTFFQLLHNFIDSVLATKNQFDYLTNIPNRSLITLMLKNEYSKFLRNMDSEYVIAFADIDNFKHVNDTYGHATGDSILEKVSTLFSNKIRTSDIVGRYGGEEFIFCFSQTSINDAVNILERIRSELQASPMSIDNSKNIKVTCSFGVSTFQANISLDESIKQADDALYIAKKNGRNRIIHKPYIFD
ncbi:diguanylate cyclase [Candidatus Halobeggiatoa sp. HSG11]|nr:diguanylate cyclase [Candidatus Halobeggiatoa sp. HSG11]